MANTWDDQERRREVVALAVQLVDRMLERSIISHGDTALKSVLQFAGEIESFVTGGTETRVGIASSLLSATGFTRKEIDDLRAALFGPVPEDDDGK